MQVMIRLRYPDDITMMFHALGRQTARTPWFFILATLFCVVLAGIYGRDVAQSLSVDPGWSVPQSESSQARRAVRERLGQDESAVILLFGADKAVPGAVDDPRIRMAVEGLLETLMRNPDVRGVDSYYASLEPRMRSSQGEMSYAMVRLARGDDDGVAAFQRLRTQVRTAAVPVRLGGELAAYVDSREHLEHDVHRAELISFGLLAVLLLWVFGSLVAAALPLLIGGVTIVMSMAVLKLFAQLTDITVYAVNVVSMLGLGLAIDYALFVVSRFREELGRGETAQTALSITLSTAGRTVAFSGLTVAASLFCLLLMPQRFFQNMGLAGGISVGVAMLSSIFLLPALLRLLGPHINRLALPGQARRNGYREEGGRWARFSQFVMRHARLVLVGSLLLLGLMGLPILHLEVGPADSRSLPLGAESHQVQNLIDRHFPQAELSPLVVSIETRGVAHQGVALSGLYAYQRALERLPGVSRVVGLTSLDRSLNLNDYQLLYEHPGQFPLAREALTRLARDHFSVALVHYRADPASPEARELVRRVRALPLPAGLVKVDVGGYPAEHLDYVSALATQAPWMIGMIVLVIYVLLFLMLGSVLLPLKAVLTNLLSLSATFGGLVWIFQDGHFAQWLQFAPQGKIEGTVLILIFASAFGLSIDYEVFLLSRVREVCHHSHDNERAIATGIQRSGPIITSAALLIGIVLGTFAMGELVFMKAMGLGLLISVLVDATLVRMLLVPATLRLLGPRSWWMPPWLARLHRLFNLDELTHIPRKDA